MRAGHWRSEKGCVLTGCLRLLLQAELRARLERALPPALRQDLVERMQRRQIDPYSAAADVVKELSGPV